MSPRLSVVVPVHSVASRLRDCLRSLAGQTARDLEVVLVTDAAATARDTAAAEEFAAADNRFRLVRQAAPPPGDTGRAASPGPAYHPGRARNTGVRSAAPDAPFLAFLDGDDTVPPTAYALLLGSLEESGSDFATGNVLRCGPEGTARGVSFGKPMDKDRQGTHITQHRNLVHDRFAGNKVFRRAFWERHHLAWPEDGRDPDAHLVLPAHLLAGAVDVLSGPVLHRGPDPSPSSPGGTDPAVLRERVAAVDEVSRLLAARSEQGAEAVKRHYDSAVLHGELTRFLAVLHEGSEEFQALFGRLAAGFAARVDPSVFAGLPVAARIKWHLVREQRVADLLAALAFARDNPHVFHVTGRRTRHAAFPRPDGSAIEVPRHVSRLRRGETPLHARLQDARWQPDGTLLLRGYAYIRSVDAGVPRRSRKFAWLRLGGSRVRVPLAVRTVPAPEATRNSRQRTYSYDAAGFEIRLEPRRLLALLRGRRRCGSWTVCLGVLTGGLLRAGGIKPGADGAAAQPPPRDLPDGRRLLLSFGGGRLRITVEETTAQLAAHRIADSALELALDVREPHRAVALRTTHQHTDAALDHPARTEPAARTDAGWSRCVARIPLGELTAARDRPAGTGDDAQQPRTTDRWRVTLVLAAADGGHGEEVSCRVVAPTGLPPGRYARGGDPWLDGAARELCPGPDAAGYLTLTDRAVQPVTDTLDWSDDGELFLSGSFPTGADTAMELIWQHSGHRQEVAVPVERTGDRFGVRLDPATAAPGELPLRQGRWYPYFRAYGTGSRTQDVPLRLWQPLHGAVPRTCDSSGPGTRTFTVDRRLHDRLFLVSGSDLFPAERGAYAQHRLSTVAYPAARDLPLRDAVLYQSFDGRQFSDSPRALHEELLRRGTEIEHLWAVRDGQTVVPPSARTVVMGSAQWHEALARSRWLVGNTHFPRWFRRRDGQIAVQTWHGTPLKRIGHDLADSAFANRGYLAGLSARAAEWSVLLSPNSFSTPVLRRAFGYDGEILESGYPRNDLLYAADRHSRAEDVRKRLEIPADSRVVLYAPTWRDDNRHDRTNCRFDLRLDLDAARAALAADHVLLVRKHYLVTDTVPSRADGFVRDVSAHPDLAELLLISDVLITDYSSLMFDFAHTGRPMLFYTYDLDHYRDVLRGFSFDFAECAPGPLLASSGEVIAALRDIGAVAAGHRQAYEDFRQAFCDLDDGGAAARVVDHMLGGPGGTG